MLLSRASRVEGREHEGKAKGENGGVGSWVIQDATYTGRSGSWKNPSLLRTTIRMTSPTSSSTSRVMV